MKSGISESIDEEGVIFEQQQISIEALPDVNFMFDEFSNKRH